MPVLAALSLSLFKSGAATDENWGGSTGDFNVAANWASSVVPTISINAHVNAGTCQISTGDPLAITWDVRAGDTSGSTGTWTQTGGSITVNGWFRMGMNAGATGVYNLNAGYVTNLLQTHIGENGTGTLNINGGTMITGNGGQTIIGDGPVTGTFNMMSGAFFQRSGNWFSVGAVDNYKGILNLSGGTIHAAGLADTASSDVNVGDSANAIGEVFVSGGTLNLMSLLVGKGSSTAGVAGTGGACQGYINQSGGLITQTAGGGGDWRFGGSWGIQDSSCVGIYNLSGGTLNIRNNFQVGAYGQGALYLSGTATVIDSGGYPDIGRFTNSFGVMDISGGSFTANLGSSSKFIVGEQGTGTLNIRGGALTNNATSTTGALLVGGTENTANTVGTVNLLGGVLNTLDVGTGTSGSANVTSTLNFNGGTLQANGNNVTFLQGLNNVYVYPNGGTIDAQGNNITIAQNLIAPVGNGVTSIPVTAAGAGYVVAPIVKITGGGGTGATAVATTNGAGGLAGIVITSPGVNYTTVPTITLVGGLPTTAATLGTVTLGANATGGLTKLGSGTLILTGANTYGLTTVSNGTVEVDGSLAGGVTVASGTLMGVGTLGGTTTVSSNAVISPGDASVATLPVGALTLNNATLAMDLSPSSTSAGSGVNDLIQAGGALTFTGTNLVVPNIIGGSGSLAGTYTLISGGTSVTGSAKNFAFLGGSRASASFDTTTAPGSVLMTVVGNAASLIWVGNNGNNWDTATVNWNNAGSADKFYALDNVTFDDTANSGNVTLAGSLLPTSVTFNNSALNYVLSGNGFIAGPTALTLNGTATVVLATSNSFTGGATINSGTLQVGNGGSAGSIGSGAVVDNGTLVYDVTTAITNIAPISGTGNLVQTGTGSLFLTVSNTYAGFTAISNGVIKLGLLNALPVSGGQNDVTVNGLLDLNTFSQTLDSLSGTGVVTTVAGGTPVLRVGGNNASTTFGGSINNAAGSLGLTKVGSGTLTLTGPSTYLNNTFVKNGTLVLDTGCVISNTAFSDVAQSSGDTATMTLQGSASFTTTSDFNVGDIDYTVGTVNLSGSAMLTAQNMYVASANNGASIAQGTVNQNSGTVTTRTSGDAALCIGGRSSASASGVGIYNLYGGSVNVLNGGNLWCGGYGTGTLNVSGGAAYLSGYVSIGRQTNGAGTLNLSGGLVSQTNTGRYTLVGEAGAGTLNLTGGTLGATRLILGLTGSGSGTVNLNGGTLALSRVSQSLGSGTFNFNGGILQATANSTNFMVGLNSAVVQSGGAVIDTQTNTITLGQGLTDGGGSLTKVGNGVLILSGTNTYSGVTAVSNGELDGASGGSVSSGLTVASGATNGVQVLDATSPWTCGTLTYNAGGTEYLNLNFGVTVPSTTVAPLQVNGDLDINGTLNIIVEGPALTPGKYPLVTYTGTLNGTPPAAPYLLPNRTHGTLSQTGSTIYLTVTSTEPITWQTGAGSWSATANNWKDTAGTVTAYQDGNPGDAVVFGDLAGAGTYAVTLASSITPTSVTFNDNAASYTIAGGGSLNGSTTALVKNGTGTVVLAMTNSYAGGTTINGGALQLGDGTANQGSVVGAIEDNALLVFANPTVLTNSGVISGTGSLGKTGAGVLRLGAVNTYSGATVVSNGVLQVGVANAIPNGSGNNDVVVNGTVDLNGNSQTFDSLSGSGIVDTLAAGTITLTVGTNNASTTFSGTLANTAGVLGLTKVGSGTLVLSSNSTYSGQTFIRSGMVVLGGSITNIPGNSWSSVGQLPGDNGTLWVRGNGSYFMFGDLNFGDVGTAADPSSGTLDLSDNASVSAYNLYVGSANGSGDGATGLVNQTNGTVNVLNTGDHVLCVGGRASGGTGIGTYNLVNGALNIPYGNSWIGGYGTGTMNQNGGTVTASNWFSIGRQIGSTGVYNISGGSLTDLATNNIFVGEAGNGTLNLSGTGQVTTVGGLVLCFSDGNGTTVGTLNLNGGSLTTPAIKTILPAGTSVVNLNGGTLKASASNASFLQGLSTADVLSGGAVIDDGGYSIAIGQNLLTGASPDGGLVKQGAGVLALDGANTYTGNTVVNNGTLLVNGSTAGGAVVSAGTLGGSGTIGGAVTLASGATLAPSAALGTPDALTVSGNVTLNAGGIVAMKLNKGGTLAQDQVIASGAVNYGGTLALSSVGTALAPNDSFQLFTAGSHTGTFASITGNPGTGNTFNFNPASGILTVVSGVATNPTNILFSVTGRTLQLSWPADHAGWILQAQTNQLGAGMNPANSAWTDISGSGASTAATINIDPNQPTVFYRLRQP